MGEYARRLSDGQEVKIGTCEDMYYLRYEDRHKVAHISGNVDPVKDATELRFRLPFPDEDRIEPGNYEDYARGERLYFTPICEFCKGTGKGWGQAECHHCHGSGKDWSYDFSDPTTVDDPGNIQLTHKCGLLVNLPCYHGEKLPEGKDVNVGWNGKSWFLELYQLRPIKDPDGIIRVYPIVHCRFCGHAWRYQWTDIVTFLHGEMRKRLEVYANAFLPQIA